MKAVRNLNANNARVMANTRNKMFSSHPAGPQTNSLMVLVSRLYPG